MADAETSELGTEELVERIAAAVYGLIVASSVMAASAGHVSLRGTVVAVVVTVVIYWLAETYAHYLAESVVTPGEESLQAAIRFATHHWRMVTASFLPLAVLLLASLFGADQSGAVLAALIFSSLLLALLGWLAATRAGMHHVRRVVTAGLCCGLGLVMIALKLALH